MRFSVAFSLLAISGIASALPNVLNPYDLASPVLEREVGTIECGDDIHTGILKMVSASGRQSSAAFEGVRNQDGFQMLDVGKGGQSARDEQFTFTKCKSSFMNYRSISDKAGDVNFGRLQPTRYLGRKCVSASRLANANARLVSVDCSESDDSSQMLQFWSLSQQGDRYYLNFLGQPNDPDFQSSYTFTQTTVNDVKLAKLNYHQDHYEKSPYGFQLTA